jgi:catechol 2,3-dioxygenase-like lactoylglutathione lyase family enzyme
MIFGAHVVVYSKDPTADRAFFREVLGTSFVDAGHGWLIFALPPAELAVHPAEEPARDELYFMCDDLKSEISALQEKGRAMFESTRSQMAFDHQDPASRRRRSGSLPAEASSRNGPYLTLTHYRMIMSEAIAWTRS